MRAPAAAAITLGVIALALAGSFAVPFTDIFETSAAGSRSFSPAGISSISVNDPAGQVIISGANVSRITVNYVSTSSLLSPPVPSIGVDNGSLEVSVPSYMVLTPTVTVNITVPGSAQYQVNVRVGAGDVRVNLASAEVLDLSTSTGDIAVNVHRAGFVYISSGVGNIQLMPIYAYDVAASTSTGDVSATLLGPLTGNYAFAAITGDVNVFIPSNSSVNFRVSSMNGGFGVNGIPYWTSSQVGQAVQGIAGSGTATITVSTVTGNAFLNGLQ